VVQHVKIVRAFQSVDEAHEAGVSPSMLSEIVISFTPCLVTVVLLEAGGIELEPDFTGHAAQIGQDRRVAASEGRSCF